MKSRDFKERAIDGLRGKWGIAVLAGLIASFFTGSGFSIELDSGDTTLPEQPIGPRFEIPTEELIALLTIIGISTLFIVLFALFIGSVVQVGYAEFNCDLFSISARPKIKTLFAHFRNWKTIVCANLLVFFRVFVATLFFFIPGIILSYKYAMVNHVLADKPYLTAREALRESKEIMRGHKWRLFCLGFSFFGWYLLVAVTFGIAAIWVYPYQRAAVAAFYEEIK